MIKEFKEYLQAWSLSKKCVSSKNFEQAILFMAKMPDSQLLNDFDVKVIRNCIKHITVIDDIREFMVQFSRGERDYFSRLSEVLTSELVQHIDKWVEICEGLSDVSHALEMWMVVPHSFEDRGEYSGITRVRNSLDRKMIGIILGLIKNDYSGVDSLEGAISVFKRHASEFSQADGILDRNEMMVLSLRNVLSFAQSHEDITRVQAIWEKKDWYVYEYMIELDHAHCRIIADDYFNGRISSEELDSAIKLVSHYTNELKLAIQDKIFTSSSLKEMLCLYDALPENKDTLRDILIEKILDYSRNTLSSEAAI